MTTTRVRLIAPSGYPHNRDAMARGVARLRDAGCDVSGLDVLDRVELRYAGSDIERAADINALATMESPPDITLAVRGGYGATRLLPHLNYGALRERLGSSDAVLVGHSDFTAIQMALYAQSGLVTFGGPMLGPDFGAEVLNDFTQQQFWDTIRAPRSTATWTTAQSADIAVEGPLWGGNLAMLCSLVGTPYFPAIDGGILFVEDVTEPPYRIERLLYQLHLSGILGRQRALLLGDFTDCRPSGYDNGYDLDQGFAQLRSVVNVPIVGGLPFGHEAAMFTLPFGAPARLRVAGGRAQLDFSDYPHLKPAPPG